MNSQFQWDAGNTQHILDNYPERENTIDEVESVFEDTHFITLPDRVDEFGEQRYHALGLSNRNTIKLGVFVIRNDEIRPVSCRTASRKERKLYYEEIR